jgi:hypothetical protein
MRFVRCDSCGAKALLAATQCPKCSHALGLRSSYGEAVPLAHCRSCDTYYPRAQGKCRWCDVPARSFSFVPFLWGAAGLAIIAGAWGIWQYRRSSNAQQTVADSVATTPLSAEPAQLPMAGAADSAVTPAVIVADSVSNNVPAVVDSETTRSLGASVPVADTVSERWVGATARTWANVRVDARRSARIVGVVRPATQVELGESHSGWSRVRGAGVEGWVDRRLFRIPQDSTRP